ncbi:hypothetical protein [Antrihabitans stalactiti]|uniref:hypothetical protein n=1 Tax=Antrihabitans stalactiti TaxID=2584121 RepID=UPI001F0DB79F|nr:hypothetical protein [Antrihabitans stalactiti]
MGRLYNTYDNVLKPTVALKVLPEDLGTDPMFRERFQREAHLAAGLNEPHVVPIFEYGEIGG